jgi:type IV secretory pathway VirB3-like protein
MGWAISSLSLLAIPILAVIAVVKAKGNNIIEVTLNKTNHEIHFNKKVFLSLETEISS